MTFDIKNDNDVDDLIAKLGRDGLRENIRELWALHASLKAICQDLSIVAGTRRATLDDLASFVKSHKPATPVIVPDPVRHNFNFIYCDRCGKSCRFAPENANGAADRG